MGEKSYAETVGKKKKEQPKGGTEQGHEKSEPGKKEKKKKKMQRGYSSAGRDLQQAWTLFCAHEGITVKSSHRPRSKSSLTGS